MAGIEGAPLDSLSTGLGLGNAAPKDENLDPALLPPPACGADGLGGAGGKGFEPAAGLKCLIQIF